MKKLDWYIFKKFIGTFFFAISLLIVVVIVFDLSENVSDFIKNKASVREIIFQYYVPFIPYFINLFIYLFTFISVIFFTSNMAGHTEIIAILSSGISFRRFLYPYFLASLMLAVGSFYLGNFLIPHTDSLRRQFKNQYMENLTKSSGANIHVQIERDVYIYVGNYDTKRHTGFKFSLERFDGGKMKYKLTGDKLVYDTINERWKITNYVERVLEDKEYIVKGKEMDTVLNLKPSDLYRVKEDFEEIKKHRDYLEKIAQAMELAGIPDNRLSFEELDKNNSALANILFAAFVNKSAVLLTTEAKDDVSFGILNLYNLKLIILAKRVKDNSFMIENFFTANLNMSLSNLEDKKYPSSRYVFLKQEHFLQGDNINYKNLYEDVTSIPINIYHFNRTTLLLLEMIKAYDVNKDKELIDVAEKLSIWLVDKSFVNNRNVALINLLQIKQRKNSINESDKQQIINMLKSDIDKQYQAACYILLNMPNQAQGIIDSMDEEQRNIFTDYPIYDLLKNN